MFDDYKAFNAALNCAGVAKVVSEIENVTCWLATKVIGFTAYLKFPLSSVTKMMLHSKPIGYFPRIPPKEFGFALVDKKVVLAFA